MTKKLDETLAEVTVMVYVNGKLVDEHTNSQIPMYAVNYVAQAAVIQVEDPDLEMARQAEEEYEG